MTGMLFSLPYEIFYERLIQYLRANLPLEVSRRKPKYKTRSNRMQIFLEDIKGSHYEMCFRRGCHEFALHFESTPSRSLSRKQAFDPHLDSLGEKLGEVIRSGPHENRGWMRVWMEQPTRELTTSILEKYQVLFTRFVAITFPILERDYLQEEYE